MRRKHCLPLHNFYENAMIWHRSTEWSTFDQIIVLALDRFPEVAARVRNLETHQTTTEINRNFMKLWDEVNPFASPMRFHGVLPSYRTKTCRMPSNAIRLEEGWLTIFCSGLVDRFGWVERKQIAVILCMVLKLHQLLCATAASLTLCPALASS